jgi:hypothetical protein
MKPTNYTRKIAVLAGIILALALGRLAGEWGFTDYGLNYVDCTGHKTGEGMYIVYECDYPPPWGPQESPLYPANYVDSQPSDAYCMPAYGTLGPENPALTSNPPCVLTYFTYWMPIGCPPNTSPGPPVVAYIFPRGTYGTTNYGFAVIQKCSSPNP